MNKDKKILYITSLISLVVLLPIFFIGAGYGRLITAGLLTLIATAVCFLIRKRTSVSINKKEATSASVMITILW